VHIILKDRQSGLLSDPLPAALTAKGLT